jgi:hypothetical protein
MWMGVAGRTIQAPGWDHLGLSTAQPGAPALRCAVIHAPRSQEPWGVATHMRQDKRGFPLITCRYAAIGIPSGWLALQQWNTLIASGGSRCNFLRRGRSANTFRQAARASSFQNKAPVIIGAISSLSMPQTRHQVPKRS